MRRRYGVYFGYSQAEQVKDADAAAGWAANLFTCFAICPTCVDAQVVEY